MFTNYSQSYAASITTLVGFLVLVLKQFNIEIVPADLELVVGTLVTLGGIVWQLIHRYQKGDVSVIGGRK